MILQQFGSTTTRPSQQPLVTKEPVQYRIRPNNFGGR